MAVIVSENGMEFLIYQGMKNYTTSVKDDLRRQAPEVELWLSLVVIPLPWTVDELLLG